MFRRYIGWLWIVVGLCCFFYPEITTNIQRIKTVQYIKEYEKENQAIDPLTDVRYQEALDYNREISLDEQETFRDAWICTQSPVSLSAYKEGKFGYLKIPKMDVKLPLYLGATKKNMSQGAAILGGTSIPIGGTDTNSVIAGHRGYSGKPFFREIEKLKRGDSVIVRNPWETLTYKVSKICVIDPYDSEAVRIQEGKDMMTLITCHPYRSHGKYRYVVYCTRGEEDPGQEKNKNETIMIQSSEAEIQNEQNFRYLAGLFLILLSSICLVRKGRSERRK